MADYKTIFDDLIEKTQIELNDFDNSKELDRITFVDV